MFFGSTARRLLIEKLAVRRPVFDVGGGVVDVMRYSPSVGGVVAVDDFISLRVHGVMSAILVTGSSSLFCGDCSETIDELLCIVLITSFSSLQNSF